MSDPTATSDAPVKLDSIFATGPDGRIFEIPNAQATGYEVTEERERELGHLPLVPYNLLMAIAAGNTDETDVDVETEEAVEGRHLTLDPSVGASGGLTTWSWHTDWQYGAYTDVNDGSVYVGMHRHPQGDERAEGASPTDFS